MEEIGQPRAALVAGAALVVAVVGCAWAWPFAIDDAFIGVRYARHLAAGAGYVWNVGGPRTDGVTPLPWAFLLAPMANAGALVVLQRAKLAGAVAWAVAAMAWGRAVGRASGPAWAKGVAVLLLAIDVPVAAHAVSGMETAFATALATLAVVAHRKPRAAAVLAGLAATLRPELVVWAVVVSGGFANVARRRASLIPPDPLLPQGEKGEIATQRVPPTPPLPSWERGLGGEGRVAFVAALAVFPFALCALARFLAFGRLAPLSVLAKPSDLAHGLTYAGAAALFTLAPIVLASPVALRRERGPALVIAFAALAHFAVIVAVGGDWMPYARLAVPIVPSMLLAFVLAAPHARPLASAVRVTLAVALGLYLLPGSVRTLRQAGGDRRAMIAGAPPVLASATRIAALDIGWVSAVSEATILDLAGVTDPEVATLPGGHTSKHIDASFLLAHDPDTVLFYSDALPATLADVTWDTFPRVVEARLARSDLFAQKFEPAAFVPLGTKGAGYVLFKRR
jgi:hypothetical protein